MPRLDPGAGRIRTAHEFGVHEGGGEYNVARALRRVSAVLRLPTLSGLASTQGRGLQYNV